jgi:hypothetical protein
MDNGGAVRPVQDDQFEQIRRPVWPQDEVSVRILADLVDGEGMDERVLDVLGIDAVAQRRTGYLHPRNRTTKPSSGQLPLTRLTRHPVLDQDDTMIELLIRDARYSGLRFAS